MTLTTVPISQMRSSAPLLNKGLFIQELHFISSGLNGIPINMPPRHRPISSVHARSTSTNQIQDGAAASDSTDSTVTVKHMSIQGPASLKLW